MRFRETIEPNSPTLSNEPVRKIIHIDMDAFFAAVEQRDNPDLRGKPIAVGYDGPRGVVTTASYEARKFGVHSAMSIAKAKQLCPHLIIVPNRRNVYREIPNEVHEIFQEYTDLVEPLSIDEAFLDVTHNSFNISLAQDIAKEIKDKIRKRLNLTASAGISYNKFLAKIASDYRKPDGLMVIHPHRALDFISKLPIEKFWGVGPKTAQIMHHIGIFNGAQLQEVSLHHLIETFGKSGNIYYNFARGIDNRPVIASAIRKSVGCEHTFLEDIRLNSAILIELYHIVTELSGRISKSKFNGRTLTLKVKFADFTQITRSKTVHKVLISKDDILPLAKELLSEVDLTKQSVRLLGLCVSNLYNDNDDHSGKQWVEGWLGFSTDKQ
ncbi:DNA polymerase IV [Hoylesella oralis]|uniref:DNA polymerase IV n=1 Tax=Hoylesella oralis TaxID=28134 RepID=UPI003620AEAF